MANYLHLVFLVAYLIILHLLYCIQQFIYTFNNNNNNNNNNGDDDNDNDDENENDDDGNDNDNETIAQKFYGQYLQYICCPFRKF